MAEVCFDEKDTKDQQEAKRKAALDSFDLVAERDLKLLKCTDAIRGRFYPFCAYFRQFYAQLQELVRQAAFASSLRQILATFDLHLKALERAAADGDPSVCETTRTLASEWLRSIFSSHLPVAFVMCLTDADADLLLQFTRGGHKADAKTQPQPSQPAPLHELLTKLYGGAHAASLIKLLKTKDQRTRVSKAEELLRQSPFATQAFGFIHSGHDHHLSKVPATARPIADFMGTRDIVPRLSFLSHHNVPADFQLPSVSFPLVLQQVRNYLLV